MNSILESTLTTTTQDFPAGFIFDQPTSLGDFEKWFNSHESEISEQLLKTGAILFRGVEINSVEDFSTFSQSVFKRSLDYKDGTTPRTKLADRVYTSTEYDATQEILPHNELSYSNVYPDKILFCCITAAEEGGETPLGDSRQILNHMPQEIVGRLLEKELLYIRNLHGGDGVGQSWQQAFETEDKAQVEAFCEENEVDFKWKANGYLHLAQRRPGIISHPETNEQVWFNQIDQFHPSLLQPKIFKILMTMNGGDFMSLPMYVTYGDGSAIDDETVSQIRSCIDSQMKVSPWVEKDVVLVDNLLACHGRRPYKGARKVLVSMDNEK